jgi:hypothetical protein
MIVALRLYTNGYGELLLILPMIFFYLVVDSVAIAVELCFLICTDFAKKNAVPKFNSVTAAF